MPSQLTVETQFLLTARPLQHASVNPVNIASITQQYIHLKCSYVTSCSNDSYQVQSLKANCLKQLTATEATMNTSAAYSLHTSLVNQSNNSSLLHERTKFCSFSIDPHDQFLRWAPKITAYSGVHFEFQDGSLGATWQIHLNLCFLLPTQVHTPNGKSIGSVIFAQLMAVCHRACPDMSFPLITAPSHRQSGPI